MSRELYQNKYRVASTRLPNRDYSADGAYFITICAKNMRCWFGNSNMKRVITSPYELKLNAIGELAERFWHEIPERFEHVSLGAFVVMPNHVHGILIINRSADNVETRLITSHKKPKHVHTIGEMLRWYKGRMTFEARKIDKDFTWLPRFWDRVIRDEREFEQTSDYIRMNPWRCVMGFELDIGNKDDMLVRFQGMGNPALWDMKKLGVLCSRNAPKPHGIPNAEVYFGGFHSPMEEKIMASLLELKKPVIYCPAWGLGGKLSKAVLEALNDNRMLILEMNNKDANLSAAVERNRFVIENADKLWTPYVSPGGMLSKLLM